MLIFINTTILGLRVALTAKQLFWIAHKMRCDGHSIGQWSMHVRFITSV